MILNGFKLYSEGKIEKALDQFQEMVIIYRKINYPEGLVAGLFSLGLLYEEVGKLSEAQKYFEQASMLSPDNHIVKNYQDFAESTLKKYTYTEVEKPKIIEVNSRENIPNWVKNNAGWWADNEINDSEFLIALQDHFGERVGNFELCEKRFF